MLGVDSNATSQATPTVFSPTDNDLPSSEAPPTTEAPSSSRLIIVIVPVVVGVALLIVAMLVAMAVVICMLRKRSATKKAPQRDSVRVTANVAYENSAVSVTMDDEESGVYYSTIRDML